MALQHVDIKDKIPQLVSQHPGWDTFIRLGNLTKLRGDEAGGFHHANYESGLLLYALVSHYRPQNILEIGTGRGYGAFCMAMALRDHNLPGKIITIDPIPYTQKQYWPLDEGNGARLEQHSLKDIWENKIDPSIRGRVELRTGYAKDILPGLRAEGFQPDFIYVDGDHTYVGARYDVLGSFLLAKPPFRMLLDDYLPGSNLYGVRRLVEADLAPAFELEAIFEDRRWYGEANEHVPLADAPYAQVLLDTERMHRPFAEAFPRRQLEARVKGFERWGNVSLQLTGHLYNVRKRLGQIR